MADVSHLDPNYRASEYSVANADARCPHCGRSTRVVALVLPATHEALDAESEELNVWQPVGANAILFYVARLPEGVQGRLRRLSPTFRLAHSDVTANSYWANHCEHCGLLLNDHDLHCEPGAPFMPGSQGEAARIQLFKIHEPFAAAAAGCAIEPEFFYSCSGPEGGWPFIS